MNDTMGFLPLTPEFTEEERVSRAALRNERDKRKILAFLARRGWKTTGLRKGTRVRHSGRTGTLAIQSGLLVFSYRKRDPLTKKFETYSYHLPEHRWNELVSAKDDGIF